MAQEFDKSAGLDIQILQVLDTHPSPTGFGLDFLWSSLCSRMRLDVNKEAVFLAAKDLEQKGLIWDFDRTPEKPACWNVWRITDAGRDFLLAHAAAAPVEPVEPESDRHAAEPDGIDYDLDVDDASDKAMLCISELELDRWWEGFDVEIKAVVFSMYTLGSDGPVVRAIEKESKQRRASKAGKVA